MVDHKRPFNINYIENPTQDKLKELSLQCTPLAELTSNGSVNKNTRNKARMAKYTYIVTDSNISDWSHQTISTKNAEKYIMAQREYIESKDFAIAIDGSIGNSKNAVPITWIYSPEGANIAGMQQVLSFPPISGGRPSAPHFRVFYTPDFFCEDLPGRQAILVDLDNWTTYIMGPDYFGESKKAALRMLCEYVYQEGGIVLHAGAKSVTTGNKEFLFGVMGLSGTGKTTTTFSKQGDRTVPVQDDMVALWPNAKMSVTENGCFAKTGGLNKEAEPVLYSGANSKDSWLENAFLESGEPDFCKEVLTVDDVKRYSYELSATGFSKKNIDAIVSGAISIEACLDGDGTVSGFEFLRWTGNGRVVIPLDEIGESKVTNLPDVEFLGILNRDEGEMACTPAIVKFTSPEQAAGYFMLGETSKTSAAGSDRGKTRSPFTQPFFPRNHSHQATRFVEICETMPDVTMWMMNTGYVGSSSRGADNTLGFKVSIEHSSIILKHLLEDDIVWRKDPDFGYYTVDIYSELNRQLLKGVPREILCPRYLYEKTGRQDIYTSWVNLMMLERKAYLKEFGVSKKIIDSVC